MATARAKAWAAAAAFVAAGIAAGAAAQEPLPRRSVVLVIGDGTGFQQWGLYLSWRRASGATGPSAFERLAAAGHTGASTTWSADSLVTDSAAGATAIASAVKCRNGAVGVDAENRPARTVLEEAASRGLACGLVTTTELPDATPAAFAAHVVNRTMMDRTAEGMARLDGMRVLLGGGLRWFVPAGVAASSAGALGRGVVDMPSARRDGTDLVAELRAKGFTVATDRAGVLDGPAPERLAGLVSPGPMPFRLDRDAADEADLPALPDLARRAIEVLGREKRGYFLMVEAGRVDHACHANDAGAALQEMRELDETLAALLDARTKDPGLLVVLTADHETGGLGVSAPKGEHLGADRLGLLAGQKRSLAAAAARARGGDAAKGLAEARDAAPWLEEGARATTAPAADGRGPYLGRYRAPFGDDASGGAGVVFSTDGHTATPVPVVAAGPGSERFAGWMDNTELGRRLREVVEGK